MLLTTMNFLKMRYKNCKSVITFPFIVTDIISEKLFFLFVSPSVNIIQESTHVQRCKSSSSSKPPNFLRHAMCCLSASASSTLSHHKESLYQSARRLLQEAEIKDQDFDKVTIVQAQTWIMIAVYELKESFLHRSLMSISRAVRLVQLLRLCCVDRVEKLQKPAPTLISSPADWLQAEERRRLFWFTFLMDRYTAVSMGWPVLLNTGDVYQGSIPSSSTLLTFFRFERYCLSQMKHIKILLMSHPCFYQRRQDGRSITCCQILLRR